MDEHNVSLTTQAAGDAGRLEGGPGGPAAVPQQPEAAGRASGWTGGRIAALVIGALLVLVSLGFLGGGATGLWFDRTQREDGYVTTDAHDFSVAGAALTTEEIDLGSAGAGWLYSPTVLDKIRIRVTPADADSVLFVGIGRSADVDRYLAGVSHTVISDFWGNDVKPVDGGTVAANPGQQDFWVASVSGAGARTLDWDPSDGTWTVVVLNADGGPGIDVKADLGARMPALPWVAAGLLVAGAVFATGGAVLMVWAIRRFRASRATTA